MTKRVAHGPAGGSQATRRRMLPALGLLLGGCGGASAAAVDPVGEWTGTLVADAGRCPDHAASRLLVGAEDVSFVPTAGVLVLKGRRHPHDMRLHAQLMLTDMNKKPLPMVFEGSPAADGSHIDGTYGTPACRAHVTLRRPEAHPLQRLLGN